MLLYYLDRRQLTGAPIGAITFPTTPPTSLSPTNKSRLDTQQMSEHDYFTALSFDFSCPLDGVALERGTQNLCSLSGLFLCPPHKHAPTCQ